MAAISWQVTMMPPSGADFLLNDLVSVQWTLPSQTMEYIKSRNASIYYIGYIYDKTIKSTEPVVNIVGASREAQELTDKELNLFQLIIPVEKATYNATSYQRVELEIMHIGYAKITVILLELLSDSESRVLSSHEYRVTAVRKDRLVNTSFNAAIAILGIMNTFAIGCVTDISAIRSTAKHKLQIAISVCTQHLIMPLVSDKLSSKFSLQNK